MVAAPITTTTQDALSIVSGMIGHGCQAAVSRIFQENGKASSHLGGACHEIAAQGTRAFTHVSATVGEVCHTIAVIACQIFSGAAGVLGHLSQRVTVIAVQGFTTGAALVGTASDITRTKVARFFQNNIKHILAHIVAWAVIATCSGVLYGFQAVALPLSIGIGCGFGFGVLAGVGVVNSIVDRLPPDRRTAWGVVNYGISHLDQNGTKALMIPIAVSVLLSATVVFPLAMGVLYGFFVGNHFATKVGLDEDLGSHHDPATQDARVAALEAEARGMLARVEALRRNREAAGGSSSGSSGSSTPTSNADD